MCCSFLSTVASLRRRRQPAIDDDQRQLQQLNLAGGLRWQLQIARSERHPNPAVRGAGATPPRDHVRISDYIMIADVPTRD